MNLGSRGRSSSKWTGIRYREDRAARTTDRDTWEHTGRSGEGFRD